MSAIFEEAQLADRHSTLCSRLDVAVVRLFIELIDRNVTDILEDECRQIG